MKHKIVIEFETSDDLSEDDIEYIEEVAEDCKAQIEILTDVDEDDELYIHYEKLSCSYSNDLDDQIDKEILEES